MLVDIARLVNLTRTRTIRAMEEVETKKPYLLDSQIEAIREEIDRIQGSPNEYAQLLSMVDHYVHVNDAADEKYKMLFNSLTNFERLADEDIGLDAPIQTTLPLLSGICLFDLLVLVGVLGVEEMAKGHDAYLAAFQRNKGTPQA